MSHKPQFEPWNKYEEDLEIFTKRFLENELKDRCFSKVIDFQVGYAPSDEPIPFEAAKTFSYIPIQVGEIWAKKNFACAWFHLTAILPEGTDFSELYLDFQNEGEALLVDDTGSALQVYFH